MLAYLKGLAKKTLLYRYAWYSRAARLHNSWTDHDSKMSAFYSQFISPGDLCFDVGANIGNRTRIFVRLGARVVAIEPQPNCVSVLKRFLGSNSDVLIENCAVGAEDGTGRIRINRGTTISSMSTEWINAVRKSGRFGDEEWSTTIDVPMTTLDTLIDKYGVPNFIKIDVEGFEVEVIRGLSSRVDVISIEFTPEIINSTYLSIDHLLQLGDLEFNLSLGESMMLISDRWFDIETLYQKLSGYTSSNVFGDVYIRQKT